MLYYKTNSGFSITELMVGLAIVGILGSFAAPNLKHWERNYRLKNAVTQLYAHMQQGKVGAVRENRPWTVRFNSTGYTVNSGTGQVVRTVSFTGGDIEYYNPSGGPLYSSDTLTFNPTGLSSQAFAHVSNKRRHASYRIGTEFITGAVKVFKWNGTEWK